MQPRRCHLVLTMALAGCVSSPAPAPIPVGARPQPAAAPPVEVPWPAEAGCRDLATALAAIPVPERPRLDRSASPLGITIRAADGADTPVDPVGDLPLPPDDGLRRCALLVEIGRSTRTSPRRIVAHERIRSVYRSSASGRVNPEHRRLQAELRQIERGGGAEILATGDPGLDLIGLLAGSVLNGISATLDAQRIRTLRERLAATPARLEEAAWEPYSFEVSTVEAARAGKVRAVLLDRATGDVFPFEETVAETRRFRVAQGRRARDRGLLEGGGDGLVDSEVVAVWEQAGVRPGVVALLAALPPAPTASSFPPADFAAAMDGAGSVMAEIGGDGVRRFRLRGLNAEPGRGPDPEAPAR
ncbi:MAG: hypothetical protein AB7I59_04240 [Geminicoccaceae bacterium]